MKHERRPTPGPRTPVTPRVRCRHRLVAAYQLSVPLVQQPGGKEQRLRFNFLFTSVPIRGGKQISLSVLCLSPLGCCRVSSAGSRGARDTARQRCSALICAVAASAYADEKSLKSRNQALASDASCVLPRQRMPHAIGQARLGQPGSLQRACRVVEAAYRVKTRSRLHANVLASVSRASFYSAVFHQNESTALRRR